MLNNQLRRNNSAVFIYIKPVGHVYPLTAAWQGLGIKGNTINLPVTPPGAQRHLQVALPDNPVADDIEVPFKPRRRKSLAPGACIAQLLRGFQ